MRMFNSPVFAACLGRAFYVLVMPGQKREARLRARCAGHPRLLRYVHTDEDVDGRVKPGHDE
jgi:hypothetical protein